MKVTTWAALLALTLALTACNQTGAGSVVAEAAASLDPTGLSGAAVSLAQSAEPEQSIDFSTFASRLSDVAAGNTAPPNYLSAIDRQANLMMARQAAGMARTVGKAAIDGALTGGVGLIGAAPQLAMQAATTGVMAAQMSSIRGMASAEVAKVEAERAAAQLVPDSDRPAEAEAILAILDGSNSSAAWQNPETGSSGKVALKPANKKMFGGLDCRLVKREWKNGTTARTGEMLACRSGGEWYDLS